MPLTCVLCRLEAEIQEAQLRAKQEMLQSVQIAREVAERELSSQRAAYEGRIEVLEAELVKGRPGTQQGVGRLPSLEGTLVADGAAAGWKPRSLCVSGSPAGVQSDNRQRGCCHRSRCRAGPPARIPRDPRGGGFGDVPCRSDRRRV